MGWVLELVRFLFTDLVEGHVLFLISVPGLVSVAGVDQERGVMFDSISTLLVGFLLFRSVGVVGEDLMLRLVLGG